MIEPTDGLPFPDVEHWRWRWCYIGPKYRVLHRIVALSSYGYGDGRAYDIEVEGRIETIAAETDPDLICLPGCEIECAHIHDGVAACGHRGLYMMPGIFSRMGLARCTKCCAKLRIPRGGGAPLNQSEGITIR